MEVYYGTIKTSKSKNFSSVTIGGNTDVNNAGTSGVKYRDGERVITILPSGRSAEAVIALKSPYRVPPANRSSI